MPKKILFGGCTQFQPLVFFLNPRWPPSHPIIVKFDITPSVFVVKT